METPQKTPDALDRLPSDPEPSSGWGHPYAIYIIGTAVLFALGLLFAYLAIENDWIPKR